LKKDSEFDYQVRIPGNGVFVFLNEGEIAVNENNLASRDAVGISETASFKINAADNSRILFIEVPMK
jgi:redox-sensitive bicupin YhaK (pirin superfamily)